MLLLVLASLSLDGDECRLRDLLTLLGCVVAGVSSLSLSLTACFGVVFVDAFVSVSFSATAAAVASFSRDW